MTFKGKPSGDLQVRVEYQGPPVNMGGQNIQNPGQQQWPQGQPGQPGQQGNQGWGQQGQQGQPGWGQQGQQPQQGNQGWGQQGQQNKPPQGNQGGWGQPQPPKQDGPGFIM